MARSVITRSVLCTSLTAAAALAPSAPASAAPPDNDERVGAVEAVLGPEPWFHDQDASEATAAADDPSCSGGSTVWFSFTGTGRDVILDTAASTYGTTLAVVTPEGELACTTTGLSNSPQAWLEIPTVPGTPYLVAVGSSFGPGDRMGLSVQEVQPYDPGDGGGGGEEPPPPPPPGPPPANDAVATATELTSLPYRSEPVDTTGATSDGTEPFHCSSPHHSVWWSYTAERDATIAFDTLASDYDTALAVVVPNELGWGVVGCSTDALGTVQSRVEVPVTRGTTYWVVVTAQFRFDRAVPGTAVLGAEEVVPLEVSASSTGTVTLLRNGLSYVDVVLTCSRPAAAGVRVRLLQRSGERVLVGDGSASTGDCGAATPLRVLVFPDPAGPFRAGPAQVQLVAEAESREVRRSSSHQQDVRIRPGS
jgi:hypothetical protein